MIRRLHICGQCGGRIVREAERSDEDVTVHGLDHTATTLDWGPYKDRHATRWRHYGARRRDYEPPISIEGAPLVPGREPKLYPGVRGYAVMYRGLIYIPLIIAEAEGSGDVGRFLDAITARCRIVHVTSRRLRKMLQRRRFKRAYDEAGVDLWAPPAGRGGG